MRWLNSGQAKPRRKGLGLRFSAEAREVEVDGEGIAFWRCDLYGGRVGLEGFGGVVELESGTNEHAATILIAAIVWCP